MLRQKILGYYSLQVDCHEDYFCSAQTLQFRQDNYEVRKWNCDLIMPILAPFFDYFP